MGKDLSGLAAERESGQEDNFQNIDDLNDKTQLQCTSEQL